MFWKPKHCIIGKCYFICRLNPQISCDSKHKAPSICQGTILFSVRGMSSNRTSALNRNKAKGWNVVKNEKHNFSWFPDRSKIWNETWIISNISKMTEWGPYRDVIIPLTWSSNPAAPLQEFRKLTLSFF